ncbi:hypothetical protein LTR27_012498 [Elasticomyces elasticus]|nr:hypothetical protein LTR27_012498 [Elasticomyces elasticus]
MGSSSSSPAPQGDTLPRNPLLHDVDLLHRKVPVFDNTYSFGKVAYQALKGIKLDGVVKHWALRVGPDVWELVQRQGVNEWNREDWNDSQKAQYEVKAYLGQTTASRNEVQDIAEVLIAKKKRYDYIQANCQSFVMELAGLLPGDNVPLVRPGFDARICKDLLEDIRKCIAARRTAATPTIKDVLDNAVQNLQTMAYSAIAFTLGKCFETIQAGIKWLFSSMPHDALTWIVDGLTATVKRMTPLLKYVAGGSTSAWNALCSEAGVSVLAGAAIALGVAWLAYEGMQKFWRWWKLHGRNLDFDRVVIELQNQGPGQFRLPGIEDGQVVERSRHQARRIELQ